MATSSASATRNIVLRFDPALQNDEYTPGQSYTVTVTGGGRSSILGSTAGSWAQSSCDRNGQTGVGSSQGVWTAPSSGSATVGGTRGGDFSYGVDTIQFELSAGAAPPTNPVTQRPTSAPTEATDEAIVNFCGSFISTCGTSLGWSSASSCRASVVRLMTGDSSNATGNTLACRIYHLGAAISNVGAGRAAHCRHASPDGDNMCVGQATVAQFCSDWDTTCSDVGNIPQAWASADACVAQAQNFPTGLEGATGGNSLACRIYHLGVARSSAPTRPHCGHASQTGEGVCVNTTVSAFCSNFIGTCGTSLGWSSTSACVAEVTGYVDGASGSVTGDTLGCRIYHLGAAAANAAPGRGAHCQHASRSGGGVCVSQPSPSEFCDDFIRTCGDDIGPWASAQACEADAGMLITGTHRDTGARNTLACRTYHLGVAKGSETVAADHCGHASASGDGVCVGNPTAEEFCRDFMSTCGNEGLGWTDNSSCVLEFQRYIDGTAGATSGNTQSCRIYHLGAAKAGLAPGVGAHCTHASRTGGGVCVGQPSASDFCDDFINTCGTETGWTSPDNCRQEAASIIVGAEGATGDDSLACRAYHLGVAKIGAAPGQEAHCRHASSSGGGVCVGNPSIENFCENFFQVCGALNPTDGWTTIEECQDNTIPGSAARMVAGEADSTSGNTLACRNYHLREARFNESTELARAHCGHASKSGAGVCSDTVTVSEFCSFFVENCEDARWDDVPSCVVDAVKFAKGDPGSSFRNTLECRAWHASARHGTTSAVHCDHASFEGGSLAGSWPCANAAAMLDTPAERTANAEEFCSQYQEQCGFGGFSWSDSASCISAIESKEVDVAMLEWPYTFARGDTAACRSYYVGLTTTYRGGFSKLASFGSSVATYNNARGYAELVALPEGRTTTKITIQGDAGMSGMVFAAHLHAGRCSTGGGGHYQDPNNAQNEIWPTVTCDDSGMCTGSASSEWVPREEDLGAGLSIVVRDTPNSASGAGAKMLCADLSSDQQANCDRAGPTGDNVCQSPDVVVAGFCEDFDTECTSYFPNEDFGAFEGSCASTAKSFMYGDPDATLGDSFSCRAYHLSVASTPGIGDDLKLAHCNHAGVDGAGVCSGPPNAEDFCETFMDVCRKGPMGSGGWSSVEQCKVTATNWAVGSSSETNTNTLGCRVYHLGVAKSAGDNAGQMLHCDHASNQPTQEVCTLNPNPEVDVAQLAHQQYCQEFMYVCGGAYGWSSQAECEADAGFILPGSAGDIGGDTLGCRQYYLGMAKQYSGDTSAVHCAHASLSGGGVCIASEAFPKVTSFCNAQEDICGAPAAACEASAIGYITGNRGDTAVDTLECRAYHLMAASLNAPPGRNAHCTHASADGGGVCVGATVRSFCESFVDTCPNSGWSSFSDCFTAASSYITGTDNSFTGPTLECRAYHLGAARLGAVPGTAAHCAHAGPSGGGVCVGNPTPIEFCTDLFDVCPGSTGWADQAACVTGAQQIMNGEPGATSGHTLSCRAYHLTVAKVDPETHCPHASMDGGGVCVGEVPVSDFCRDFVEACPGDSVWTTSNTCTEGAGNLIRGEVGALSGDSLECRIYHLGAQKAGFPGPHCDHAGSTGGGVCFTETHDRFCTDFGRTCTGLLNSTMTFEQCQAGAQTMVSGIEGSTSGDTFECRRYHLAAAIANVAPGTAAHCDHASPAGGEVCVGKPSAAEFCASYQDTCGADPAWSDTAPCEATIQSMITGLDGSASGNSYACRLYHLGAARANLDPGLRAHCGHSSIDGGGVCDGPISQADFCVNYLETCGADEHWSDFPACMRATATMAAGELGDVGIDTFQCRVYHLSVANANRQIDAEASRAHCTHASQLGGGVCVSPITTTVASPEVQIERAPGSIQLGEASSPSEQDPDEISTSVIVGIVIAGVIVIAVMVLIERHLENLQSRIRDGQLIIKPIRPRSATNPLYSDTA